MFMDAESRLRVHATLARSRTPEGKVNICALKKFAWEQLPNNWPLREILLTESDEIDISTFLARLPVYLRLSSLNRSQNK